MDKREGHDTKGAGAGAGRGERGPTPPRRPCRRSLLQAGLVALGVAAAGAVRGGKPAEAGRTAMFVDEPNIGAATTALRSDVAQETFLVENRAPGGGGRAAVYGYLGTPAENRPLLPVNAGLAGVSNAGGAGVYGFAGTASDVGVSAESPSNGVALRVKGRSLFTGIISADDGSGIKKLNATNISNGKLSDDRLSSNIPRNNAASNVFSGKLFAQGSIGTPKLTAGFVDADFIKVDQTRVRSILGPTNTEAPVWIASGKGVVPQGEYRVRVHDPYYAPGAKVLATIRRDGFHSADLEVFIAFVSEGVEGRFTVYLNDNAPYDAPFDYFICR